MEPPEPVGTPTPNDWTPWAPRPAGEADSGDGLATETTDTGETSPGAAPATTAPTAPPTSRRRGAAPVLVAPTPAPATFSVGGVVVVIGAVIAIGGTFLNMVKVSVGLDSLRSVSLGNTYFDADRGKIVAGIAAAVLVVALIGLLHVNESLVPATLAGLGGIAVVAFSVYDRIDLDTFIDEQRASVKGNALRSLFDVNVGPALYVCIGGGVIIIIGALMAASRK